MSQERQQNEQQTPVIRQALGDRWQELSSVVRRHYDITPGEDQKVIVHGVMEKIWFSTKARLLLLFTRVFGALLPYRGTNIETSVRNYTTCGDSRAMYWYRIFKYPYKPTVVFKSRMEYLRDSEIVEYVRFGIGVRLRLEATDGALLFYGQGYVWKLGKWLLPLPAWVGLGQAFIVERGISDGQFEMDFRLDHSFFGQTFAYRGTSQLAAPDLDERQAPGG